MSNYDLEEDILLKYQIFLSVIFIFTLFISITLSYNSMMELEKKNKIYKDEDALKILRINRVIALSVAIGFLLINVQDKKIKEKYGKQNKNSNLQISASLITIISSLIVLYVAFTSNNTVIGNENPGQ